MRLPCKKSYIDEIFNQIVIISVSIALICLILNIAKIPYFRVPVIIEVIVWTIVLFAFFAPYVWKKIIDKQKIKTLGASEAKTAHKHGL